MGRQRQKTAPRYFRDSVSLPLRAIGPNLLFARMTTSNEAFRESARSHFRHMEKGDCVIDRRARRRGGLPRTQAKAYENASYY